MPQNSFIKAFWLSQNLFEALQRSVKITIYVIFNIMPFFIPSNYFTMLGTTSVNKVFTLGFFINDYKHENNFTNVPFRHSSACVIQKWLEFKRVITIKLWYIA